MAKDPAVLFYTSDFLSGVSFFTMEERGQYITLLCLQHQKGSIPENHMINVCGSNDSPVFNQFIKDKSGCYYNERMRFEAEKRANFCASRSNNKSGRPKSSKKEIIRKSHDNHMNNHMENENENENDNINKVFRRPKLEQVKKYCEERKSKVDPEIFFDTYESTDWIKANGQKVKNWKATIRTWEKKQFNEPGVQKPITSIKQPEYVHPKEPTPEEREKLAKLMKETRI